MTTSTRRLGVATLALGAATMLAIAAPLGASAHVTLEENTATPGESTTLTFRVPNETADGAATNKLTVTLPTGKGLLASVRYLPVPGWTTELITTKLAEPVTHGDDTITHAVTQVVWTADAGSEYGPGSEGIFKLLVGPIPDVGQLKLPADQGYSDGSVVSWSGSVGSEHPAPVLYIDDTPAADDHGGTPAATVTTATTPTTADGSTGAQPDLLARVLGGLGLLLGAVSVVVAAVGRRPQRKVG